MDAHVLLFLVLQKVYNIPLEIAGLVTPVIFQHIVELFLLANK